MLSKIIFKTAILFGAMQAVLFGPAAAGDVPKKGSQTFTIHYVYHPIGYSEVSGVGKITALEAIGRWGNINGDHVAFSGDLSTKCHMVSIEASGKTWTEGACTTADGDGHLLFATFDSRNLDKSQPKMDCGSYVTSGGTGKFKGISATGAYTCVMVETPKGEPAGSFAMDVSHVENWQMLDMSQSH
jgi:hypothetical protein